MGFYEDMREGAKHPTYSDKTRGAVDKFIKEQKEKNSGCVVFLIMTGAGIFAFLFLLPQFV